MDVGQRIKERRLEMNMSLEDLAKLLNVNRSTIYRYESGETEKMPIGVIKPIAQALLTTPEYLLGWDEEEIEVISAEQEAANAYSDSVEEALIPLLDMNLTLEEIKKLIEYAKFLISQRKE